MDNNEVFVEAEDRAMTSSTLLLFNDVYYRVEPLSNTYLSDGDFTIGQWINKVLNTKNDHNFDYKTAYLDHKYFYLYRGEVDSFDSLNNDSEPGIYKLKNTDSNSITIKSFMIIPPSSDEDKILYKHTDKISRLDIEDIATKVANSEIVIFNTPDSSHSVIPAETPSDDLLKRIIKRAILSKGIDIDQYKTRFVNKNMLFNLKQVLRGDSRLSVLLFDRGIEAFNLKYTIIVEENGGEIVGLPLDDKIIISSEDTFDAGAVSDEYEE